VTAKAPRPANKVIAEAFHEVWGAAADEGGEAGPDVEKVIGVLLARGIIRAPEPPLPPDDRARDRRGYADARVRQIADRAGHPADKLVGWLLVYGFPERDGYGLGALTSGGEVWEAIRRINEREIAEHLRAAMVWQKMRGNGDSKIIRPGGGGLILP
jgi:hypothetical protein